MASQGTTHTAILKEIQDLEIFLVEQSLADDQNFAFRIDDGSRTTIQYRRDIRNPVTFGNVRYDVMYRALREDRHFNFCLLDGAMVQMWYEFESGNLVRHRLAFFPAPDLDQFQNDPESYLHDERYADVVDQRVVTVPIRFDFDGRDGVSQSVSHPISHMTLGQYLNCRIPVSGGLTPHIFMDFILRNFYNTAARAFSTNLPNPRTRFGQTILDAEESIVHIGSPVDA